ncbi:plexin domain-containing protein 2-like isoform X2 [Apostichopus japonicus]|uniref:plexin domain-containing protein 2-like isoform X2 n=1 Tax=Stichopus japonicus TaxID=307972 RepID=UPI003AB3FC69
MCKILYLVLFGMVWLQTTHCLSKEHPRYQILGDSDSLNRRFARQSASPDVEEIIETDFHNYYNSSYYASRPDYFIDLEREEDEFTTITHVGLSSAHLRAAHVELPFVFPFYGHNLTAAYIATGGFLYVGTIVHDFLTVTQYIAPLMGNFDSSLNDSTSTIKYGNNGTAFTVEWRNIHVNHLEEVGGFTFQTTLFNDGRIVFAYKNIPVSVDEIRGGNGHSVTVGLSDGFYTEEPAYEGSTLVRRTIYKYHEVSMETDNVQDTSAFEFFPLPTCNQLLTCSECVGQGPVIHFDCSWCGAIERCSSGLDRHRDEWVDNQCDLEAIYTDCPVPSKISAIAILAILLVSILFMLMVGWLVYAYRFPNTASGLYLIEAQSFMKGKFSREEANDSKYIVDPSSETIPEPVVKASNGGGPAIITTTTSSEA